jgi:hypothetical protein
MTSTTTTPSTAGSSSSHAPVGVWGLASVPVDPTDASEVTGFSDLPGLAARLARMGAELRLLARNAPVWAMGEVGLGDAIEQAQSVREMAHALTAVLTAEVDSRGLAADAGLSRNDWVAGHAPGLADGAAAALTAVGAAMNEPRWQRLSALVRCGDVSVEKAAVIVRFRTGIEAVADADELAAVIDSMVEASAALGIKQLRRLAGHARAVLRPPADVEDEAARLRAGRSLTKVGRSAGLVRYLLQLDPEGAAILDAALDPLARPRPDLDWAWWPATPGDTASSTSTASTDSPTCAEGTDSPAATESSTPDGGSGREDGDRVGDDGVDDDRVGDDRFGGDRVGDDDVGGDRVGHGCDAHDDSAATRKQPDPRSAPTRRADALLELIGRAVSSPEGAPTTPRTKLVVTMTLEALLDALRGAGVTDTDEVLSAGTVRRLACEAQIIPMVLGGPSQVLDLGQSSRFFSPAQRLALGRRDGGCSYPGCTVPAAWCDAHHVVHWSHGGRTDPGNGALLCGRHHTIVHQLDLTATVDPDRVTWHVPWEHRLRP